MRSERTDVWLASPHLSERKEAEHKVWPAVGSRASRSLPATFLVGKALPEPLALKNQG